MITLTLLTRLETLFKLRQSIYTLDVEVEELDRGAARVLDLLSVHGIIVYGVQSEPGPGSLKSTIPGATRQMRMQVQLPRSFQRKDFNTLLMEEKGVVAFHLE